MTNLPPPSLNAAMFRAVGDVGGDYPDIPQRPMGGWRRWVFPSLWLVYLGQTVAGVHDNSSGAAAVAGYAIVGVFAVCYFLAIPTAWTGNHVRYWSLYGTCVALTVAEAFFAGNAAFVFCVYLSVLTVISFGKYSLPVIVALAAVSLFGSKITGSGSGGLDGSNALAVVLVAIAMWGFFGIMRSNLALSAARAEVARLAAENERSRIARDLHDLLGHSLTTITVKAGLARRLTERGEVDRAAVEVAEVEALGRRTLSEVRAAVAGYRDVTLSGELASAHEVLRAAGITPELPGAIDNVDDDAAELFGWVVREGVTNVVRHSRAARCTVTLGPRWVEIIDDGRGGPTGSGNGLSGLRERVEAAGGTLRVVGSLRGWRLRAELPTRAVGTGSDECADHLVQP
ncbi:MAG TPA: sensor histidine kinase [Jatrophihabitantaceae bacterium]|nr:sensor histidine kinase [Jatrophihabitantaceae bacterium]